LQHLVITIDSPAFALVDLSVFHAFKMYMLFYFGLEAQAKVEATCTFPSAGFLFE
jgi:hypothetical protein